MKKIIALIGMMCLSALYAEKPNVLMIYVDDMGSGDVSFGNPNAMIQTPRIDALADSGMILSDAHSSSGLCSSSRYAILTGEYHWRRFYGIVFPFEPSVFKPNQFTVASMFKSKGYKTAIIGKWHLGWDWKSLERDSYTPAAPRKRENGQARDHYSKYNCQDLDWSKPIPMGPTSLGFDYYFGDDVICFPPYLWIENDKVVTPPTKMIAEDFLNICTGEKGNYRGGPTNDDWAVEDVLLTITKRAVRYISEQSDAEPFFLYLPLPSPHAPVVPTKEFQGKSKAGAYGDFVEQTDYCIGLVLDELDRKGLRDNTIIVFTSDNGACEYTYDRYAQTGHWSSGLFRGIKRDVFEGGHHVPFVVSWKNRIKAGSKSDALISQVDLVATFANIIGYDLAKDEAVDSFNVLPVWDSKELDEPIRKETIHNTNKDAFALRQGNWVFINSKSGDGGKSTAKGGYIPSAKKPSKDKTPALLYNLKEDIAQVENLYKANPERVKNMKKILQEYRKSKSTAPHCK